jgi:beta-lactamase regulating signal transducer with metallopeptidase domain
MTILPFLAEWAIRSSILIAGGALLLWILRVKDASIRLAAWTAMLAGSLAIPALTAALPKVPIPVTRIESRPLELFVLASTDVSPAVTVTEAPAIHGRFDRQRAAVLVWAVVVAAFLLRLVVGIMMAVRLLRRSSLTGREIDGIQIRESDRVAAPATLGVVSPVIVLPVDWREWDGARLEAILAHERSHVQRHDPALQVLSAIHRALLWYNPLSWFLHRQMVRLAEEVSDDAAIAVVRDRSLYAEVLLEFMQRGVEGVNWLAVPMARYGRADRRIHRILDGTQVSRGVTRWSLAAILAVAVPSAYLVATARTSQAASQAPVRPAAPAPVQAAPAATPARPPVPAPRRPASAAYLNGLGTVSAMTVTIRSRVDGELTSVGFEEGKPVAADQLIASINPNNARVQLETAQAELARDKQRLANSAGMPSGTVVEIEDHVNADQREVNNLNAELAYGQVRTPLAGVAGLRKIDPGNFVRVGDTLVVITQLQPIAVVFTIPEDYLARLQAGLRENATIEVEAWSRDMTVKYATGRLIAIDNLIDESSGTVKLKAMFDNKDESLFPNQFVNVRLPMNSR